MIKTVLPKDSINGIFSVPGDKSISHRAVMFGAIADGVTEISGFLEGDDCLGTISCFRGLGVKIEQSKDRVTVHGKGMHGLTKPDTPLYVGNSGTTIRLMSGILAAQKFTTEISGDASIQKRPMNRVIEPLRLMGADIRGKEKDGCAPLIINGAEINGINYTLPVASAQVKSAILLAGIYAGTETVIHEPLPCRDHTEIMLNYFGADIKAKNKIIICKPVKELYGREVNIPGDISSAAFFIVAGLILPNSSLIITNVGVNFTRTGIITVLREMGGHVEVLNKRLMCGEWVADIEVKSSKLSATTVQGAIIPRMIDEIPVFAVAAMFAEGVTVIKEAQELKVKESNRISAMAGELAKMGADIEETEDGMIIRGNGGVRVRGASVNGHEDHRVAMSLAIAAAFADGATEIDGADCVGISFPEFFDYLSGL